MVADLPCLLDANVVSYLRVTEGLDPFVYVGSRDLVVSRVVRLELQAGLPPTDRKFIGNEALIASLGKPILIEDDRVKALAADIQARYVRHQPPPTDVADLAIAATAIVMGRVLVTRNWKHFHYIEGLRMIDARPVSGFVDLAHRAGVIECAPNRACCQGVLKGR